MTARWSGAFIIYSNFLSVSDRMDIIPLWVMVRQLQLLLLLIMAAMTAVQFLFFNERVEF